MKVKPQKAQLYNGIITTPIGKLGLTVVKNRLTKITFLPEKIRLFCEPNAAARRSINEIKRYFYNPRSRFRLSIKTQGTRLQQKIWQALQKIPCGKSITYGELAEKVGTSPRVIGNACRCNPIPIVIPCHRVVAATGTGGYCGKNNGKFLQIKKWLLTYECDK